MGVLSATVFFLRAVFLPRAALAAENLALRQQLAVLQVSVKRPRLRKRDRIFWVWPSRIWSGWRSCLMIVKPETGIGWHRQGFRLYWRWKSRKKPGRPKAGAEVWSSSNFWIKARLTEWTKAASGSRDSQAPRAPGGCWRGRRSTARRLRSRARAAGRGPGAARPIGHRLATAWGGKAAVAFACSILAGEGRTG
jgi:hypothetical protein